MVTDLRSAALSGVRWTAAARLVAESAGLASIIVTSRLLTPAEVGQAALGFVVTIVAGALAQQGFGAPIVRNTHLGPHDVTTAHILSLGAGTLVGALVWVLAPLLDPLGDEVSDVVRLAAFAFPLNALGAVPLALKQRDLAFRELGVIEAVSAVSGAASMVALVYAGLGPQGLIAGPLVVYGVTSLALLASAPPVWGHLSLPAARAIARFGFPVAASGFLFVATRNVDYAILATTLSLAQVGLYFRAYQLGVEYQSRISIVMLRMSLPLLAQASDPDQLRRIRTRMTRSHAIVLFPLIALLASLAPHIVPFVFGDNWSGAIEPTQILSIAGAAAVVATGTNSLLIAAGHPRAMLAYHIVELVLYATVVIGLVRFGLTAVCGGVALITLFLVIGLQRFVVQPLVGIRAIDSLVVDLVAPLTACVPLALIALGIAYWGGSIGLSDFAILLLAIPSALAAYIVVLRGVFADAWNDVMAVAGRR